MGHSHEAYILYVSLGFLVACLFFKCIETVNEEVKLNNKNAIELFKKSLHWNTISQQDTKREIAYQHINYAIAYMNAARECATDIILEKTTKTDIHAYKKIVHNRQSSLMKQLSKVLKS